MHGLFHTQSADVAIGSGEDAGVVFSNVVLYMVGGSVGTIGPHTGAGVTADASTVHITTVKV